MDSILVSKGEEVAPLLNEQTDKRSRQGMVLKTGDISQQ